MSFDKTYKEIKDVFGIEPERTLKKYLQKINRTNPILDIGAGQGRNSIFLAESGFVIDAIEPSSVASNMLIDIAKKKILSLRTYNNNFDDFTPTSNSYSALLIFGLLQILDRDSIERLIKFVNNYSQIGTLIFITAFSKDDNSYQKYEREWKNIGKNSFKDENGNFRTYLESGEILNLFPNYKVIHHWEGLGEKHRHGDSQIEQHAMIELVVEKSE